MPTPSSTRLARYGIILALLLSLAAGIWAVSLGKDTNWDLRNYHYYNAFAFVNDRLDVDVVPAQLQSFYNPLFDLPFYWMANNLWPWLVGFVYGSVQALSLGLILAIYWRIRDGDPTWQSFGIGAAIAIMSGLAPGFLAGLGTTFHANLVCLSVLGTLYLLLSITGRESIDPTGKNVKATSAGLVMGIGLGLQPSGLIFVLAFVAMLFGDLFMGRAPGRYRILPLFCLGLFLSLLLSAGNWAWTLYNHYQNPIMPYLNNLFKSSFIPAINFLDRRFLPQQLWEYFVWPVIFTFNPRRVSEMVFWDIRFLAIYSLFLIWILKVLACKAGFGSQPKSLQSHKETDWGDFNPHRSRLILIFFSVAFVSWMVFSSAYRHLVGLELLVPLCFFLIIHRVWKSRHRRAWVAAVTAIITLHIVYPAYWGRTHWGDSYVPKIEVSRPSPDEALVVMLGYAPTAYVIPQFPANFRFVRPQSNLGLRAENRFKKNIDDIIKTHTGDRFVLFENAELTGIQNSLHELGIPQSMSACQKLNTGFGDDLRLCRYTARIDFDRGNGSL